MKTAMSSNMRLQARGDFHQGDERYAGHGRQCTAMAMAALAFDYIKNIAEWDTDDINFVMEEGDKMYIEAIKKCDASVTTLIPSDIDREFTIDNRHITLTAQHAASGILDSPEFAIALSQMNQKSVITFGQIFSSYAIACINRLCFYVFDSHSRDEHGLCVADGAACVTSHNDLNELLAFVKTLSDSVGMDSNFYFDIVDVLVSEIFVQPDIECINEDDVPLMQLLRGKTLMQSSESEDDLPLSKILQREISNLDSTHVNHASDAELISPQLGPAYSEESLDESLEECVGPNESRNGNWETHYDAVDFEKLYESEVFNHYSTEEQLIPNCISPGNSFALSPYSCDIRKSRKRKRDYSQWKINTRKRLRNSGEEYTRRSGTIRKKRELQSGCGPACRNKCSTKITDEERLCAFHGFWKLGCLAKQRDYLCRVVEKKQKKVNQAGKVSRRANTYIYNLEINKTRVQVCKKMFMDTFDINDRIVATAISKTTEMGVCDRDKRGKHVQRGLMSEKEETIKHIDSFPRVESHYSRKDSQREYLEGSLSLSKMYSMYLEKRKAEGCEKPASESSYRSVFNFNFNIGFHKRMKDRCDICSAHENGAVKDDYDEHLLLKNESRTYKDKIKAQLKDDPLRAAAVFDLEEVLSTPSSMESLLYYKRKLNVYNLTVYDYKIGQGYCHVWNETEGLRGSNEIASCVFSYLQRLGREVKNVTLFSDSCGGQNRNRNFLSMLWFALQHFKFQSIEHVFFVTGHSQNEGDCIHSTIERASKNIPVYVPSQWAQVMRTAKRRPPFYIVEEFDRSNMFNFKMIAEMLKNFELDTQRERIKWLKVKRFKLSADKPNIVKVYYDYSDQCKELNLLQKLRAVQRSPDVASISLEKVTTKPYPLSKDKHNDLLTLCKKNIIPQAHHHFYENLPYEE